MQMSIFKEVINAHSLEQTVGQRSTGYSEPLKRRVAETASSKSPIRPLPDWPVSHRGGKSGQEATQPNRKSFLTNNIHLRTLLATGFSKWPGGLYSSVNAGQARTPPGAWRRGGEGNGSDAVLAKGMTAALQRNLGTDARGSSAKKTRRGRSCKSWPTCRRPTNDRWGILGPLGR